MKPILFSTPMIISILGERKTATRRVIKGYVPDKSEFGYTAFTPKGCISCRGMFEKDGVPVYGEKFFKLPYVKGDILWVRETWQHIYPWLDNNTLGDDGKYYYAADGEPNISMTDDDGFSLERFKWMPSIFMPREAARIFLRVTDVRVERLQDIAEEDAIAEGVSKMFDNLSDIEYEQWARNTHTTKTKPEWGYTNYLWHGHIGETITAKQSDAWSYQCSGYESARDSFSSLWESLSAKNGCGWDTNPFVWVISFERVNEQEAQK